MKRIYSLLLGMTLAFPLSACSEEDETPGVQEPPTEQEQPENNNENHETDMNKEQFHIKIKVSHNELSATLQNNATTRAFIEKLPLTLPMMDLYGREMCYRFTDALPTDNVRSRGYEVGEIVYWPPRHSLVIMYAQNGEHFDMQQLGKIESGVELFETTGDTDVTFSL